MVYIKIYKPSQGICVCDRRTVKNEEELTGPLGEMLPDLVRDLLTLTQELLSIVLRLWDQKSPKEG